jgi:hypothetical protein
MTVDPVGTSRLTLAPELTLAFTLTANPGTYALLLGSGVSSGAVLTGWEVLRDLVQQMASTSGADAGQEPFEWFKTTYGVEARYDSVLEALTASATERVELLRPYFEPDEDDDREGRKQPTEAHRAIAQIIKEGQVRIVLTTNFDRLLERALEELGVVPTVLSNPAAMHGAAPLHAQKACVVKLHGDVMKER